MSIDWPLPATIRWPPSATLSADFDPVVAAAHEDVVVQLDVLADRDDVAVVFDDELAFERRRQAALVGCALHKTAKINSKNRIPSPNDEVMDCAHHPHLRVSSFFLHTHKSTVSCGEASVCKSVAARTRSSIDAVLWIAGKLVGKYPGDLDNIVNMEMTDGDNKTLF